MSPELRQYDHIIEASKYVKKEAQFSLFGVSNLARGVAGGVFDSVPIQDGLGFGTPASIRIAKSQTEMLRVQKDGALEVLRRQLRLTIANLNLNLQNYPNLNTRVQLTDKLRKRVNERLRFGETVDSLEMAELSRNSIQAKTSFITLHFQYLINKEKLNRLILLEEYGQEPPKQFNRNDDSKSDMN